MERQQAHDNNNPPGNQAQDRKNVRGAAGGPPPRPVGGPAAAVPPSGSSLLRAWRQMNAPGEGDQHAAALEPSQSFLLAEFKRTQQPAGGYGGVGHLQRPAPGRVRARVDGQAVDRIIVIADEAGDGPPDRVGHRAPPPPPPRRVGARQQPFVPVGRGLGEREPSIQGQGGAIRPVVNGRDGAHQPLLADGARAEEEKDLDKAFFNSVIKDLIKAGPRKDADTGAHIAFEGKDLINERIERGVFWGNSLVTAVACVLYIYLNTDNADPDDDLEMVLLKTCAAYIINDCLNWVFSNGPISVLLESVYDLLSSPKQFFRQLTALGTIKEVLAWANAVIATFMYTNILQDPAVHKGWNWWIEKPLPPFVWMSFIFLHKSGSDEVVSSVGKFLRSGGANVRLMMSICCDQQAFWERHVVSSYQEKVRSSLQAMLKQGGKAVAERFDQFPTAEAKMPQDRGLTIGEATMRIYHMLQGNQALDRADEGFAPGELNRALVYFLALIHKDHEQLELVNPDAQACVSSSNKQYVREEAIFMLTVFCIWMVNGAALLPFFLLSIRQADEGGMHEVIPFSIIAGNVGLVINMCRGAVPAIVDGISSGGKSQPYWLASSFTWPWFVLQKNFWKRVGYFGIDAAVGTLLFYSTYSAQGLGRKEGVKENINDDTYFAAWWWALVLSTMLFNGFGISVVKADIFNDRINKALPAEDKLAELDTASRKFAVMKGFEAAQVRAGKLDAASVHAILTSMREHAVEMKSEAAFDRMFLQQFDKEGYYTGTDQVLNILAGRAANAAPVALPVGVAVVPDTKEIAQHIVSIEPKYGLKASRANQGKKLGITAITLMIVGAMVAISVYAPDALPFYLMLLAQCSAVSGVATLSRRAIQKQPRTWGRGVMDTSVAAVTGTMSGLFGEIAYRGLTGDGQDEARDVALGVGLGVTALAVVRKLG